MIKVEIFTHEPFQINSYLIWDEERRCSALVDCGRDIAQIMTFIKAHDLVCQDVFQTHGFLEFLEGQPALRDQLDLSAYMSPQDEFWLAHLDTQAIMLSVDHPPQAFIDQQALDGDSFSIGSIRVNVLHTPGNTPGGLSYYMPGVNGVFVGDLLYAGDLGPTDVPYGDTAQMTASVRERILTLPDDTVIYPGRGPITTVGWEKKGNSFKPRPYAIAPSSPAGI
ncbi:MAG: MBL fold metallo-hydrolase [Vampirovibrionales bacterium]|nr:MBL fold metallo-hydrolase [Vampirovibrionales bacterium]